MKRYARLIIMTIVAAGLMGVAELSCAQTVSPGASTSETAASPDNTTTSPSQPRVHVDRRKLLVPPRNPDGTIVSVPFTDDPVLWLRDKTQSFYGAMSSALRNIRGGEAQAATLTLLLLSFGYGIFHAAGPGHGKMVITAWLLATRSALRRGILVAFLSSVIQAITAISLVSIPFLLFSGASRISKSIALWLEHISFAAIIVMGLYLIWTALHPLLRTKHSPHNHHPHQTDHGHQHHTCCTHDHDNDHDHSHKHDHAHQHDESCGHAHVPTPAALEGDWSFTHMLSMAFAIGIRPCTGSILVLVLAYTLGIYWAGILATFVMAFGTFITIASIATIAVYSRNLAEKLAARDDRWLRALSFSLRLCGGLVIVALGSLLLLGSLSGAPSMG